MEQIISKLAQFGVEREDIAVLTISQPPESSDIDVYCVTKTVKSSVHLFYDESHIWNELFIDNVEDTRAKLKNQDEIVANFLTEMPFVYGEEDAFEDLTIEAEKVKENYILPENRLRIIKYRVKVLSTKFLNHAKDTTEDQQKFILNSICYPIVQLALAKYRVLPSSPKKWILQLKQNIPQEKYEELSELIRGDCDAETLSRLVEEYAGDLPEIHLDKSTNNKITFLS